MQPCEDFKQTIPQLRRYARALASHLPDPNPIADGLVQAAFLKTMKMRSALRDDFSVHIYRLLIELHREAQSSCKTPAASENDKKSVLHDESQKNAFVPNHFPHQLPLTRTMKPKLSVPFGTDPAEPSQISWTSQHTKNIRSAITRGHDVPHISRDGLASSREGNPLVSQHERAIAALKTLRLDEKEAYLLVVLEGFNYSTAARILRISKTALAIRLLRARTALSATNLLSVKPMFRRVSHLTLVK